MLGNSYFLHEKRHFAVVSAIVPIGRGISHSFTENFLSFSRTAKFAREVVAQD
ncbi:hypothetical protein LC593_20620 [Nostoc sp. CHAB 5844]|nr:hypothetical protein [Nostoc sp. CHAB 5844]